ncbi:unnamed protein product, partial [Discosporangium mesarthrocarpum]
QHYIQHDSTLFNIIQHYSKPTDREKAVVKPLDSAGTDDVFLVTSREEAKECFSIIDGKVNGLGSVNEGALVQEYLDGTEYVVDSVSRDGVHRVCAIWEYDKRTVNGATFVYFGMELRPLEGKVRGGGGQGGGEA